MDLCYITLTLVSLIVSTYSVLYSGYEPNPRHHDNEGPCCNGTLGVASNWTHMPCSAMRCCNSSETVAVFPVNYALGYSFRCLPKEIFTACYSNDEKVVSTNETTVKYEARRCCDEHKFRVFINHENTALIIKCTRR